eukprot:1963633-Pleurochrysis_carterae.AAC.1
MLISPSPRRPAAPPGSKAAPHRSSTTRPRSRRPRGLPLLESPIVWPRAHCVFTLPSGECA